MQLGLLLYIICTTVLCRAIKYWYTHRTLYKQISYHDHILNNLYSLYKSVAFFSNAWYIPDVYGIPNSSNKKKQLELFVNIIIKLQWLITKTYLLIMSFAIEDHIMFDEVIWRSITYKYFLSLRCLGEWKRLLVEGKDPFILYSYIMTSMSAGSTLI